MLEVAYKMSTNISLTMPQRNSIEPTIINTIDSGVIVNFLDVHKTPYRGDFVCSSLNESAYPRVKDAVPSDSSRMMLLSISGIGTNREYINIISETINSISFQSFSNFLSFKYFKRLSITKSPIVVFVFLVINIIARWDLVMNNQRVSYE